MIVPRLETEICEYLHRLPPEQQRQVLEFVRALAAAQVRGVPGQLTCSPKVGPRGIFV